MFMLNIYFDPSSTKDHVKESFGRSHILAKLRFKTLLDELKIGKNYDYFTISNSIRNLLEQYTIAPKNSKQKVKVTHSAFADLQKDSQKLIQSVVKEIYKNDLDILRKAFIEKFEFYLRLIDDTLQKAECQDSQLLGEIAFIREQIAKVVNESELDENDLRWLKKIGFTPINIWEISFKTSIEGVMQELRNNVDEYKLILGEVKYIVKILKFYKGLDKLKRLRSFYRYYSNEIIEFNGGHLTQIVLGAGWEEKLRYFEDEEKLKRMKEAGFNAYHLATIVRNAGWEEKLRYFEDEEKLKRMKEAGFNASHLSQIVRNAGWEEKLRMVLTKEVLDLLSKKIITHDKLAKLCMRKNWREEIERLIEGDF